MSPQEKQQLQLANARERKATSALERARKELGELRAKVRRLETELADVKKELEAKPEPEPKPKPKRRRSTRKPKELAPEVEAPKEPTDGNSD